MKKPTIKSTVISVVLGGALYGLCANAHIGIFPCDKTESTLSPSKLQRQVRTYSSTCSILGVNREPVHENGKITDNQELNVGGYLVCGVVFGLVPIGVGLFFAGTAGKDEEPAQAS